jgi:hypothetical protein
VNLTSVLVPAGVALATTVIVEWMVKPGLEARKIRMMRHPESSEIAGAVSGCSGLTGGDRLPSEDADS